MINFYDLWSENQGLINHYNHWGNIQVYQTILQRLKEYK
jgi:hypothetical protein